MLSQPKKNVPAILPKDVLSWEDLEKVANFTYLEDKYNLDQKDKVAVYLAFLINGFGAYARTDFSKGDTIGVYTGEISRTFNPESKYTTNLTDDIYIDALNKGNYLRFFNHAQYQYNCVFDDATINGKRVVICRAIADIRAGQQFLINYGIEGKFYSLHPDDNWLSAQKIVEQNNTIYQVHIISNKFPSLNLNVNDQIYISKIGAGIFAFKELSSITVAAEDISE